MSEIWNLNTLCRCCHADGYFKSLKLSYQGKNDVEIYEIMLKDTLGVILYNPSLEASYTICDDCITKLRDAANFKTQVLMCEQKFTVYCRNEQFLNTAQDSVKVEVNVDNYSDGESIPVSDTEAKSNVKTTLDIKAEYNIEVDIKNPIEDKKDKNQEKQNNSTKNIENAKETALKIIQAIKVKKKVRKKATLKEKVDQSYIIEKKTNKGLIYSCKNCGGCYKTKKTISYHIYIKHSPPVKCEFCPEVFTPLSYKLHLKSHTENGFDCPHCGKKFSNKCTYRDHVNTHTKNNIYKCDICMKEFVYKQVLKKHIKWHAGLNKVKLCELCGRSFNDNTNLRIHIRAVHEKQRPFSCELCDKTFTAKKHLKAHLTVHSGDKSHTCDVCHRTYVCLNTLKSHKLTHEGKYKCKHCNSIFEEKTLLKSHLKSSHQSSPCLICGKVFSSTYSLNRHVDEHNGVKKFSCDLCQLKFSQKAILIRHIVRKHGKANQTDGKTKCLICKRSFKNIQSHMTTHTNRKFSCELCGKSYSENNTLTRHKLQKHFGRTFDCDLCGKKYVQKAKLVTHKLKAHKLKIEVQDSVENTN